MRAYAHRELSPVDVVTGLFERIADVNPTVNAFYETDEAAALQSARASEARWAAGKPAGALDGVPVSVKDHLHVIGFSSPRGQAASSRIAAKFDAPAVARLRESGAILFAKSNMPEISVMPVTDSLAFGPTRHPMALHLSPGGSSGGAAAAVAAGLGPLALCTDGGGSIRIPAALTGLVGFKPTHGRVPYYPRPTDRTVAGPIGRTVADVARMMNVIARPDGRDWTELPADSCDYLEALAQAMPPLRIGYSASYGFQSVDPEVLVHVERGAARLSDMGHHVEAIDFVCDDVQEISHLQAAVSLRELAERVQTGNCPRLAPSTLRVLESVLAVDADGLRRMYPLRETLVEQLLALYRRYDVIVSPTMPVQTVAIGEFFPDGELLGAACRSLGSFTRPHNIAHTPALSIPCGVGSSGMPIGIQLAGPKFADARLLALGQALQNALMNPPRMRAASMPTAIGTA